MNIFLQIIIYAVTSYLIYGAFLVWRDFHGTSFIDAPMYVNKPSIGSLVFALLMRPFSTNFIGMFIKVGIIGFALYLITKLWELLIG